MAEAAREFVSHVAEAIASHLKVEGSMKKALRHRFLGVHGGM